MSSHGDHPNPDEESSALHPASSESADSTINISLRQEADIVDVLGTEEHVVEMGEEVHTFLNRLL